MKKSNLLFSLAVIIAAGSLQANELVESSNPEQILIQVHILDVVVNDNGEKNIRWQKLRHDSQTTLHVEKMNSIAYQAMPVLISTAVGESEEHPFTSAQALIDAIQQQVVIQAQESLSATTLHDQEAILLATTSTSYVESTVTTISPGIFSDSFTHTLNPAVIKEGVTLHVTSAIMDGGHITLNYDLQITNLDAIKTLGSEDSFIQLPVLSHQKTVNQVSLLSGQTLVINGVDGVTSPVIDTEHDDLNSEESTRAKTRKLILITPVSV